jgi:putative transposase
MARAKRHYIPEQIWHLTHRCHKREFLFKLVKDKRRWLQWLFEAKQRYGLVILNFTVTSNHIHLLVFDEKGRDVIPSSIKLIAGRTGQEYNLRKKRKGAFWEDRYHAMAIESEEHLLKCIIYIDLNMVRNGVASHPSEWSFCGYNEIQNPRKKNALIAYQKLAELTGFESYTAFQETHEELVNESLVNGINFRQNQWTESIAVGSKDFVETIKEKFGILAKGRKILEKDGGFHLREERGIYIANSDSDNANTGSINTYYWDIIL